MSGMEPDQGAMTFAARRARWRRCNRATLEWMLARPGRDGLLDTKVNSLTLRDYGPDDGLRGPDWTYGWIQGRGLEALVLHAEDWQAREPAFAARLMARARALYARLVALRARDGHVYFLYDRAMTPVRPEGTGTVPQTRPDDIYTYADLFAAKGLVAASARFAPDDLPGHLDYLAAAVASIPAGRFQMDEAAALGSGALARQPDDFGPRMIATGACPLLERLGQPAAAAFGTGFVRHILSRHFDARARVLRNVPGQGAVNAGHGIELAGFGLSSTPLAHAHGAALAEVLAGSFALAFHPPGIRLSVDVASGAILDARAPWWALPETLRASAWAWRRTGEVRFLRLLEAADDAFFTGFWRPQAGLAYQTLTEDGPLDFVPATPDLDPGYHTGLSLLWASEGLAQGGADEEPAAT